MVGSREHKKTPTSLYRLKSGQESGFTWLESEYKISNKLIAINVNNKKTRTLN